MLRLVSFSQNARRFYEISGRVTASDRHRQPGYAEYPDADDLMFGRGYALQRMGLAGLSGVDTGK